MKCECCGKDIAPALDMDTYKARALPRLAAIDALSACIDFNNPAWKFTPGGERWTRLMQEQSRDEAAAGL